MLFLSVFFGIRGGFQAYISSIPWNLQNIQVYFVRLGILCLEIRILFQQTAFLGCKIEKTSRSARISGAGCKMQKSPSFGSGIFRFGRAALYTNTLPPINSRMMELFTMMLSSSMTLKYFRNFSMRCASIYSGSSCPISARSGAAYFFSTANS